MEELPDVGRMFSDSWELFLARFGELLLVGGAGAGAALLGLFVPLLAAYLAVGLSGPLAWTLAAAAGLSAALWAASWSQAALIDCLLDPERRPWADYYRRTSAQVVPFSWVCLLAFLFVAGGGLLLLLPGVYLGVALFFAPFVCLGEGLSGMAAIERCLELARGRWWAVALRLALIWVATALPSMVPIAGPILGAASAPFVLACSAVLYRSLRATAPPPGEGGRAAGRILLAAAVLGFAWPLKATWNLASSWPRLRPVFESQFARILEKPLDPALGQRLIQAASDGSLGTEAVRLSFDLATSTGTAQ